MVAAASTYPKPMESVSTSTEAPARTTPSASGAMTAETQLRCSGITRERRFRITRS
jgi:hypothetical protein